jgi:uncharacterized protein YciI
MFLVFLRFSERRDQAGAFMKGHNEWLQRGFDDGVFLVAGSLQPKRGGALIAHNTSLENLRTRVAEDPFVIEGVVEAEVLEVSPAKTDERLRFLLEQVRPHEQDDSRA